MKLLALILIFAIVGMNAQDPAAALDDASQTGAEYIPSLTLGIAAGAAILSEVGNLTGGDAGIMYLEG